MVTSHPRSAETCLGPGHAPVSFLLSLFDKFCPGHIGWSCGILMDFVECWIFVNLWVIRTSDRELGTWWLALSITPEFRLRWSKSLQFDAAIAWALVCRHPHCTHGHWGTPKSPNIIRITYQNLGVFVWVKAMAYGFGVPQAIEATPDQGLSKPRLWGESRQVLLVASHALVKTWMAMVRLELPWQGYLQSLGTGWKRDLQTQKSNPWRGDGERQRDWLMQNSGAKRYKMIQTVPCRICHKSLCV